MKFLAKLFQIGTNVANETGDKMVDSLIDIRREGNGIIRKIDKDISEIEGRTEEAQTLVCKARLDLAENNKRIETSNKVVKRAVKAGNDEDALAVLTDIANLELMSASYQSTIDTLEPVVKEQVEYIKTLKVDRNNIHNEIVRLDIEERNQKAKLKLLGGKVGESAINMDELRERVKMAKARVEAKKIVNADTTEKLVNKYTSNTVSAQERLDELKAKLKEN